MAVLKIALVHRRFDTDGGMERWLVGYARWLVREGHDVHMLCNEARHAEPGVHIQHLPMLRPLKLWSLWRSARSAVAGGTWDAVMGFGRTPGHHLFRAGGGSHREALRRLHPLRRFLSPADWYEVHLDRLAVESARIVIANSRMAANALVRDYRPRRVEVVHNGVDLDRFRPDSQVRAEVRASLGLTGPTALFLGAGFRRKGLDTAIAALPAGWSLLVAGADRPWAAPACVRFLGGVRDPERLLQAADAMVLPTRYDPFANSCLEALACGVPVLTTPQNGASEVLPEDWMVVSDVASLREAFARIEPSMRDRMRAAAELHPADRCFSRTFALLREAVS